MFTEKGLCLVPRAYIFLNPKIFCETALLKKSPRKSKEILLGGWLRDHLGLHSFGNRNVVELQDIYTAVGKVRRDFAHKYLQQKRVPVESRCQIY